MQNTPYPFLTLFFSFFSFSISSFISFLFFFSHAIPNLTSVCYKIVHPLYIIWIHVDITKDTSLVNNKKSDCPRPTDPIACNTAGHSFIKVSWSVCEPVVEASCCFVNWKMFFSTTPCFGFKSITDKKWKYTYYHILKR